MSRLSVNGSKINDCRYVFQVVRFIYEGMADTAIIKTLKDRYGFEASAPLLAAFKKNFYETRLQEMIAFSKNFQQVQTGKIQTFIDESMHQAEALKKEIEDLEEQLRIVQANRRYTSKFDKIFQNALDRYLESYDPDNPIPFLEAEKSEEERSLAQAVRGMGGTVGALAAYVAQRDPANTARQAAFLSARIADHRELIVKIHKDIFKSYRNYSILQELTLIFEEYNAIIIEEFFPDRSKVDQTQFARIKQRIMALYDKMQVRYQGVEAPMNQPQNPHSNIKASDEPPLQTPQKRVPNPKGNTTNTRDRKGKYSKIRTIIKERITTTEEEFSPTDLSPDSDLTPVEVQNIMNHTTEEQALAASGKTPLPSTIPLAALEPGTTYQAPDDPADEIDADTPAEPIEYINPTSTEDNDEVPQ